MGNLVRLALFAWGLLLSSAWALSLDNIQEGSIICQVPHLSDTLKDTTHNFGDSVYIDGKSLYIPYPAERQEVALPSVRTKVQIIAGDGFAFGRVIQVFNNPFDLPMAASYVFPLPHQGAVHAMDFKTSTGVYHAQIMEKGEAEQKFADAVSQGLQASILLQSQDNIFQQKLANILPGDSVIVTITFSMALDYDMGVYELSFPTTMIPRYKSELSETVAGSSSPSYVPSEFRGGNSLDFNILLLTPYAVRDLIVPSHDVTMEGGDIGSVLQALELIKHSHSLEGLNPSLIRLKASNQLPNRDIVVRFSRQSASRDLSVMSYHDGNQGYFAMQLYPDLTDTVGQSSVPLDIVFVIDKSGSMSGAPMTKAKEIMRTMLQKARPEDRISLLAFSNTSSALFEAPAFATAPNVASAQIWVNNLAAEGGTEMLSAVQRALQVPMSPNRLRVIAIITDGAIGGVQQIYDAIKIDDNDNIVFAFGVGQSPNRELIEGAAEAGGGTGQNLLLTDDPAEVVNNFWLRIRSPQLNNVSIDWGGLNPTALTRLQIGNLWVGQPILLFGKYQTGGLKTITLNAQRGGVSVQETYTVNFTNGSTLLEGVPKMWARESMEILSNLQDPYQQEHQKEILALSLEYSVLCKYSAFLAVSDSIVNEDGKMIEAKVPLIYPAGVDPYMAGGELAVQFNSIRQGTSILLADSPNKAAPVNKDAISLKNTVKIRQEGNIVQFSLRGRFSGTVSVVSVFGQVIKSWWIDNTGEGAYNWFWNVTETDNALTGQFIPPGVYYVLLQSDRQGVKAQRLVLK